MDCFNALVAVAFSRHSLFVVATNVLKRQTRSLFIVGDYSPLFIVWPLFLHYVNTSQKTQIQMWELSWEHSLRGMNGWNCTDRKRNSVICKTLISHSSTQECFGDYSDYRLVKYGKFPTAFSTPSCTDGLTEMSTYVQYVRNAFGDFNTILKMHDDAHSTTQRDIAAQQ